MLAHDALCYADYELIDAKRRLSFSRVPPPPVRTYSRIWFGKGSEAAGFMNNDLSAFLHSEWHPEGFGVKGGGGRELFLYERGQGTRM